MYLKLSAFVIGMLVVDAQLNSHKGLNSRKKHLIRARITFKNNPENWTGIDKDYALV